MRGAPGSAFAFLVALAACEPSATSDSPDIFRTSSGPYVIATTPGVQVTPLATVGDVLPGSNEPLAPVPDGIGVWRGGDGVMNLMMNHELSGVRRVDGVLDFEFARVSKMQIDIASEGILSHEYVLDGSEGYVVLCSASWMDEDDGLSRGYYFTGEERDTSGRQLAIDADGNVTEMLWMGAYAHEAQTVVPGFDDLTVLLNFDDSTAGSSRNGAGVSELYMFVGADTDAVMSGDGQLYVFAPRSGESGNVGDLVVGDTAIGQWKPIPRDIAWSRDGVALQAYVDSIGVFVFVRPEDGWYDKRPGHGPAAMFYDTGRDERVLNSAGTGPADLWGSFYYVDFDPADPTGPTVLTLLARSTGPADGWASPDNGDMLADGTVMLMEDPANSPWTRPPGIWTMQFTGHNAVGDPTMIAEVFDPDCTEYPGCDAWLRRWETSGIVDASEFFGPGAWLLSVQAHSKPVPSLELASNSGQLILLRTPQP